MKLLPLILVASTLQITVGHAADQASPDSPTNSEDPNQSAAAAESTPDATLTLHGGSVAAGVGYVWANGSLTYQGTAHKFKISGVSVVDIGAVKILASGDVTHLSDLSEFAGVYTAWSAGATFAGGGSVVYMKNEHGVVIKLVSSTQGLRFNLSGSGVKVSLQS